MHLDLVSRVRRPTLVVGGHDEGAVERDGDGAHCGAHLWHQLAAARVRGQVPHPDVAVLVACARQHPVVGLSCLDLSRAKTWTAARQTSAL